VDGFFETLGEAVGTFIRFIVENLGALLSAMGGIIGSFITGLSNALGVTPSLLSLVVLLLGLWLLYVGCRAFVRKSFIAGIIWLLLGLWLLSGLIS
jgi:ABC-type proline/glycine betaine transport system permease subunit